MEMIDYSIPMRTAIIFDPVGLMTSRNIFSCNNQHLLYDAARRIMDVTDVFEALYGSKKAVVHCGNLGNHGSLVNHYISNKHKTVMHERGQLKETIELFLSGPARFLFVVSAEYGIDLKDIDLQFILKTPYASMDDRLRAFEKVVGSEKFKQYYTMDALNRLIQQCGRVGRGAGGFGITFILDEKFIQIYRRYRRYLPQWFKDRLLIDRHYK